MVIGRLLLILVVKVLMVLAVSLVVVALLALEVGRVCLVGGVKGIAHLEGLQRISRSDFIREEAAKLRHVSSLIRPHSAADLVEVHHFGLAGREDDILGSQRVQMVLGCNLQVAPPIRLLLIVMNLDLTVPCASGPLRVIAVIDTHGCEVLGEVQTLLLHGVLVGQLVVSMGCC